MENLYLVLIVILFALAISDLVVGVSNDAVNFLNSAIGSKAAPKWIIFAVAGIGILIGTTFSSGMMEVARKGIFHPDMFVFSEIMILFLAVMITDVILLDAFNTLGLPTSTSVSLVFELLGAAVAVSLVKISHAGDAIGEISKYINSEKALAIISGILISVVIAFTVGTVVQYLARLLFSFRYEKSINYFGSAFGGLAIAAITHFILIEGMHGSIFANIKLSSGESLEGWVTNNSFLLLVFSFIGWTIVMQLLKWIFNIDVLKVIVLVGTFALAMAFAGNDLVNFIGVPLAGFKSYQLWVAADGVSPDSFTMEMLKGKVDTPVFMLLISGLIMIITLIASRKAKSVIATTVDLSRQNEGDERFASSLAARVIVRFAVNVSKTIQRILPDSINTAIEKRFVQVPLETKKNEEKPAFDKIRASCNLLVASILISMGTSLKLPLSTTYVTFMVAMGTSLADRAWGRESAVYRISGVFTVIAGWFLTAVIAFSVAAMIAWIISISGSFMIFIFIGIAIFMVMRTQVSFRKKSKEKKEEEEEEMQEAFAVTEEVLSKCKNQSINAILTSNQILSISLESFFKEDRTHLKEIAAINKEFNKKSKKLKGKIINIIGKLQQNSIDSGHYYVQVIDYRREMAHSVNYLLLPLTEHLENNHRPFLKEQSDEMSKFL
ncbi:MAG: phosphate permease, partial [Bacteroidetes bacterium GWA2_42_15]